jgi:hypothetical protein
VGYKKIVVDYFMAQVGSPGRRSLVEQSKIDHILTFASLALLIL